MSDNLWDEIKRIQKEIDKLKLFDVPKKTDLGGGGGGVALGSALPQPTGTAAVGGSADASHEDHVHTLGNHAHAGVAGDGGKFPLVNLQSGAATANQVPLANGSGGITWGAQTQNNLFIDQSGGTADTYGVLGGTLNGINTQFTVSQGKYVTGTLTVYLNGQLQTQGTAEDWTETTPASGTFDFITAPLAGDQITVVYGYLGIGGGGYSPPIVPADIYIATTGDDVTGDGTIGTPFATMAKALSMLPQEIVTDCTIHVADGTYAEPIVIKKFTSPFSATLTILGNTTTPANVVFTGTTTSDDGAGDNINQSAGVAIMGHVRVKLEGIKVNVTAFYGIMASNHARLNTKNVIVTGTMTRALPVYFFSQIVVEGTLNISGFSFVGVDVNFQGAITIANDADIDITGPTGGGSIGLNVSNVSSLATAQYNGGTATITITEVQYGIISNLSSNAVFGTGTTIVIDNVATAANSYAFYTTDTSSMSSWGPLTIDHFTLGFFAICLSYQESQGSRTLTNLGGTSSTATGGVVTLV